MSLQFFKYPDIVHWRHENLLVLGEDEHGLWIGNQIGNEQQKGTGPVESSRHAWVFCSAPNAWWSLVYNGSHRITHYVDIITPRTINGDRIEMIDLDLDVGRLSDGTVFVDDEDEFIEHQKLYGYPEWMIDRARTSTAEIVIALERSVEPFGATCHGWYERFLELHP